ncbi:MAG: ATP-dependent RNA helicase dbp7 [Alectoria fallacina]|uniref:ATP-dependent RNA helicase n=1 Tax=Alectoria fallacina TaxID=1903189 RepID=A0A8H3J6R4_9LECA|nr:MAG: ATP-dependent RNA helicase dbp7 [Alectoria fallacina]
MADDGMLMNFSVGEDSLGVKAVFKGGRWRDRLQAKKSAQRRREKHQTNGALTGSNAVPTKTRETNIDDEGSRPTKRQRVNGAPNTHSRINHVNSKPHEVVSSLFTYNLPAKPSAIKEIRTEDAPAPVPSNAPLDASLSTFTSLGLSPFLSTHLIQNLNLTAPTAIQKATITQLLREDSDAFIQAETGSGKTLAYLLPIVQRIMALSSSPASSHSANLEASEKASKDEKKINRTSGLFALILAPTRELTHQISTVLTRLLRPMPWLVAGTVTGGAVKNHEKARLRKGLNILVATPGRLVDHLDNTEVLDVGTVRWLVLDEGDRLMELGFEEDIKGIVQKLEKRKDEKKGEWRLRKKVEGLPEKRTTVMCSATMKMGVQRLGEISLKDAVHIKADPGPSTELESVTGSKQEDKQTAFLAPAQLKQSYIVVPPKQRLVTLAALLKRTFARKGSAMKAIVFLSCADSVNFHFQAFSRKEAQAPKESPSSNPNTKSNKNRKISGTQDASTPEEMPKTSQKSEKPELPTVSPASSLTSPSNPGLTLYELHGSLAQPLRTATLQSFTRSSNPCILLCTDVASRGLDLPNIDLVIEYDPPFSADDHLHRVGRTARAGKEGRACCFLMPGPEEGYVEVLKECAGESVIKGEAAEDVLRKGFGKHFASAKSKMDASNAGSGKWDDEATAWQLELERWVIDDKRAGEMARKAYVSHVRAYATHVAKERGMFDVKGLHLGHLAKAFALRERPGNMGRGNIVRGGKSTRQDHGEKRRLVNGADDKAVGEKRPGKADLDLPPTDGQDAAKKMRMKMKEHIAGASEFNIG